MKRPGGDCADSWTRVSVSGDWTGRSGPGVTAVAATRHGSGSRRALLAEADGRTAGPAAARRRALPRPVASPAVSRARCAYDTASRRPARVLVPRGPAVHLYGRQHIDLQRVAGALCCR